MFFIRYSIKVVQKINVDYLPNMKMKQVAIARMFVGYEFTEIAVIVEPEILQLRNGMNAIAIE